MELTMQLDLRVDAIEPIGNYALRLLFSDGHNRGNHPRFYLSELTDQGTT
jgi:DUF971 family protein